VPRRRTSVLKTTFILVIHSRHRLLQGIPNLNTQLPLASAAPPVRSSHNIHLTAMTVR
jgi:hypothetical protein